MHGGPGEQALSILHLSAERRAGRQTLSVYLCRRIAIRGIGVKVHYTKARMKEEAKNEAMATHKSVVRSGKAQSVKDSGDASMGEKDVDDSVTTLRATLA